jgi:hypothetical protein
MHGDQVLLGQVQTLCIGDQHNHGMYVQPSIATVSNEGTSDQRTTGGRIARWAHELSGYNYKIEYLPGRRKMSWVTF